MNEKELDLNNINEIDMECSVCDDDDEMFVVKKPTSVSNHSNSNIIEEGSEERDYNSKTGVIINLNDDEDLSKPLKTIKADLDEKQGIKVEKNFNTEIPEDFSGFNEIDMECSVGEDDDDSFGAPVQKKKNFSFHDDIDDISETHFSEKNFKSDKSYDDYMDEIRFSKKELVDEDMLAEKKTTTTQGAVEANYWAKLQKKHKESNKKGAYNTHFHLAGNPEKEREMFNHDMTPQGKIPTIGLGAEGMDLSGAPAAGSSEATTAGFTGTASGGEGMGESLCEKFDNKLNSIFNIIGFDVINNGDGSYVAIDTCDSLDDYYCNSLSELLTYLKPYIDDCFIYPLQIETGEKFEDYSDWVNWYTSEKEKQFPKCKSDIEYCRVLSNCLEK